MSLKSKTMKALGRIVEELPERKSKRNHITGGIRAPLIYKLKSRCPKAL